MEVLKASVLAGWKERKEALQREQSEIARQATLIKQQIARMVSHASMDADRSGGRGRRR